MEQQNLGRNETVRIREFTEIALHVPNELTLMAQLFGIIATQHHFIIAWCFYSDRERVRVVLITTNHGLVLRSLNEAGFEANTSTALVLPRQLSRISIARLSAELRAAGVEVLDFHACCSPEEGPLFVLTTSHGDTTLRILEAMDLSSTEPEQLSQRVAQAVEQLEPAVK